MVTLTCSFSIYSHSGISLNGGCSVSRNPFERKRMSGSVWESFASSGWTNENGEICIAATMLV
jgi:hypothetical protein